MMEIQLKLLEKQEHTKESSTKVNNVKVLDFEKYTY